MSTAEIEQLLADARLVREYGARAGRLPDNALANAIAATERALLSDPTPDLAALDAALTAALNTSVRAIAPMTLIELRAGRSPFDTGRRTSARALQACLTVCTIAIIALVGYFTQLLHQEDIALKALQRIQDARPLDKLNAVRKMVQLEGVLDKRDSQYDGYHRAVTDLRNLQDEMATTYDIASSLATRSLWPFRRAPRFPGMIAAADGGAASGGSGVAEAATAPPDPASAVTDDATANAQPPCKGDSDHWLCGAVADLADEFQFSTGLKLGIHSYNWQPTSHLRHALQSDIAVLNGWVLPLLYGLLGAAVFLMRNMLDTRTPSIDVLPSILRIALGGVAGIVIGWFWVPPPSQHAELAAVTSAPFALAFLAGFSIDILFSLLDRLNRTITDNGDGSRLAVPAHAAPGSPPSG